MIYAAPAVVVEISYNLVCHMSRLLIITKEGEGNSRMRYGENTVACTFRKSHVDLMIIVSHHVRVYCFEEYRAYRKRRFSSIGLHKL